MSSSQIIENIQGISGSPLIGIPILNEIQGNLIIDPNVQTNLSLLQHRKLPELPQQFINSSTIPIEKVVEIKQQEDLAQILHEQNQLQSDQPMQTQLVQNTAMNNRNSHDQMQPSQISQSLNSTYQGNQNIGGTLAPLRADIPKGNTTVNLSINYFANPPQSFQVRF